MPECNNALCAVHRLGRAAMRAVFNRMIGYQYTDERLSEIDELVESAMLPRTGSSTLDDELPSVILEAANKAKYY